MLNNLVQYYMNTISKQDLINATKDRKLFVVKDFCKDVPSWKDINNFYDMAKKSNTIVYGSFGTMVSQRDRRILDYYKKAIHDISLSHKGNVLFSLAIVHFINTKNNVMHDDDLVNFFSKFTEDNPKKIKREITIKDDGLDGIVKEDWVPKVHSDEQERFFIQGIGQSLWKVFHDNKELNYEIFLNQGDMAYIPKGVFHSVESMCPRHSVSIAFSDDPDIIQA